MSITKQETEGVEIRTCVYTRKEESVAVEVGPGETGCLRVIGKALADYPHVSIPICLGQSAHSMCPDPALNITKSRRQGIRSLDRMETLE